MDIALRDYQQECVDTLNSLAGGSVLVSMATGLGKTVVFSHLKRRGKVLIISHREELVRQPIKYFDCACGIEQGTEYSHGEQVVSASIQSLIKRLDRFSPDEFDTIITDEAHHAAAPSYKKAYNYFTPRLHIGFTATPNRGDKVRLDDVFDKIVFQRDLKWGINKNWLTDIRCLRVKVSYDLVKVKRRMGDFVVNELDRAVNNGQANREIAEVYRKYAKGQTLIFATSVSHAENIAAQIEGAVVVSQSTKNRKEIIDAFTRREIPCIVNCMIFTEGTDIPLIETIIIARPTQNASLYTQMVGRGLRKAQGKQYLTLIDCVGVTEKLSVCTAPSLVGLDTDGIPEFRRERLQGMLTDMPTIVEQVRDCPEAWIFNVHSVNLFASEQGVDTHSINWTKKSNGDLVYQFACGDRIGVKAIDELGKTRLMRYFFNEEKQGFEYKESAEMTLQDALTEASHYFNTRYADERNFWDVSSYGGWTYLPASEKQLEYIKRKLPTDEWENLKAVSHITKGDAAQIINMLNIRDLKPSDLLRMHKQKIEKDRVKAEENLAMSKLKIRNCIDKKVRTYKYYAIKHPTDLVITNSWQIAEDLILALDGVDGKKCRYKSFLSIEQARKFLRE